MEWKILIVDDEPEILRTLKNYLALSDFSPLTASNGNEALEIVKKEKVHIVISDIKMPGMDGLALLSRIHEIDFSIQVIMMTGYSTFDITLKALEMGAADYILKPFDDLEEIVRLIGLAAEKLERWKKVLAGSSKSFPKKDVE